MSESTRQGSHPIRQSAPPGGFPRRDFLKGSGAVAAATAIQSQVAGQEKKVEVVSEAKQLKLNVNGMDRTVKAEGRTTLLEVLRYQLDLTGAKPVSTDGSSGASTVLVDGKPMSAETLLALACEGKKIQTVESLGGDKPDAVVSAFIEHDAQQCGFCTPGFVVAVRAFLNEHPAATEEEIRAGLNDNICRCGTYFNIVNAAIAVVKSSGKGA
jgi:xanthine dehydrogenase YagT iron-sulfur-binding subunit